MYNHDYYATLDQAMVKLLKHTAFISGAMLS